VRIDRSDLADAPNSADVAYGARSAPDNQETVDRTQDWAADGDGPFDSAPVAVGSALRIERSTAYRAAVEATYQQ
jgi:hypothetical protein